MSISIPNYRVLDKIGTGAGSTLFKVKCMRTGALYTVKHIKIHTPEDQGYIEQLKDEYATASVLDHPVLRKAYEVRYVRRRLRVHAAILFMEYVDGIAFRDPEFRQSLPELMALFARAAEGLHAMHKGGFVHADLKPGNVLLTPEGEVKLIDFGQSCRLNTSKTRVQGTIDYMAPEQVAREALDQRTDVFGLGATLHRVITGRPVATDMNQTVNFHTQANLGKRVEELTQPTMEDLPICVQRLIQDACNKDRRKRPTDMRELRERLLTARTILLRPTPAETAAAPGPE